MTARKTIPTVCTSVLIIASTAMIAFAESDWASDRTLATEILDATGIHGGVIVHLGSGDGKLTAALRNGDSYLVHGIDTEQDRVEQARAYIRSCGRYGPVSVDVFDGRHLPYADNLVNLLVAEHPGDVPMTEFVRVLAPRGVALIAQVGEQAPGDSDGAGATSVAEIGGRAWLKIVKPWPDNIDQWTHYLHGADGNPVAQDWVVGPPKRYQWVSRPLWLRSHESDSSVRALVTAQGRLFYISDDAPTSLRGDHALPDKWFLTARDAFNGMLLWKVPIQDWGWRAWKPSWFTPRPGDIPLNIQKRLVAIGDKVYVTLGYRAPVSELDAKTGEVLKTYEGTGRTAEILYHDGVLILSVLQKDRAQVVAVDARGGEMLWTSENDYGGTITDYYRFRAMHGSVPAAKIDPTLNTATDGKVIALLDGGDVVGLDFETGKQKWRTPFPLVPADYKAGGIDARQTLWRGTLIVRDGVVVHASPHQMAGIAAGSGEILWTQAKKYLQHLWFEWMDVFVIDGLVWTWSAELDRGALAGSGERRHGASTWPATVNGYDLQTGQLRKQVPLGNIFKTHHHHRCYRNKATPRYILASRRGTEFVDLDQGQHSVHNWVRGTCHLGMMPANGLQYAPPHPCTCYIDEKLNGFHALAPAEQPRAEGREPKAGRIASSDRLERGPAYSAPSTPAPELRPLASDWLAFRGDAMRTGSVKTKVPATPELLWQTRVTGKIAPPIVVDDRLFVPAVDQHHVVALDNSDGKRLWEYAAGGRIDSPPTYYRGTVIFGSADGWVYSVRAADGRLVWRFRAAPEQRRIGAFGQLESAWPVHGSVLVLDRAAYFAAGRSSHLDGGIYLYAVDAASGQLRHQTRLAGPTYEVGDISQNYQLPMGALPDILQGDEGLIFMRELAFNTKLEQQNRPVGPGSRRVRAKGGLLDDSYFKRTPWTINTASSYARLIVHDDQAAYGIRMFDTLRGLDPTVYFTPGQQGYLLFAIDKSTGQPTWKRRISIRIKAMVVTPGLLLVAGSPDVVDLEDPLGALAGRKGGVLAICDRTDGKTLWQYQLSSPPVFNGMAAATGRLYVAMQDGNVACFGKQAAH